jgi:vacuolar-type H+-ATPase subunit E/Vma4
MEDAAKLSKLSKTVYDEAEHDAKDLIDSALKQKNAAIEREKINIDAEIKEYIRQKSDKIKNDIMNSVTLDSLEHRRSLLAVREAYIGKVFALAAEKLKKFKASADYEPFLRGLYGKAAQSLGNVEKVKVSADDFELMKSIALDITVEAVNEIKLGGLAAENGTHIVDYTFDKKFRAEAERFVSTSAFIIDN